MIRVCPVFRNKEVACPMSQPNSAQLQSFLDHLNEEEKSQHTIAKYSRDVELFLDFCQKRKHQFSKETVKEYKKWLQEENYKVTSVNSMIVAVNQYMRFLGHPDCVVKILKTQNRLYSSSSEELTREDYEILLQAAATDKRLSTLMKTLAGTGVRVSELTYFTVEAVEKGCIEIQCKNKIREIVLQASLQEVLLDYANATGIENGPIFLANNGNVINRNHVWRWLQQLSWQTEVSSEKVFPHNFRKLFARTVYQESHDLSLLADLLGHTSLNTTRIYIKSTKEDHLKRMEQMHSLF